MQQDEISEADPKRKHYIDVCVLTYRFLSGSDDKKKKSLPAMQGTGVQSLGWEDTLEKATATHSSILAWKIPRMEEPGLLQSMGLQRVGMTESLHMGF